MIRKASHAGSWYSASRSKLNNELNNWLKQAVFYGPCQSIISPHAGFSYSGATAACGFINFEPSKIKRIFILGPSHHVYLNTCALSPASFYETPLYNLEIDQEIYRQLKSTKKFKIFNLNQDEAEHSLEMQLPYIAHIMKEYQNNFTIVPIVVGSVNYETEEEFGILLSKYLMDPQNIFVISSDFCHWGKRFQYTYHDPNEQEIYKSIEKLDHMGMDIIESLNPKSFHEYIKAYGNTICGRHPIAILLQMIDYLKKSKNKDYSIKFVKYTQSNQVKNMVDSSVSYATALVKPNEN